MERLVDEARKAVEQAGNGFLEIRIERRSRQEFRHAGLDSLLHGPSVEDSVFVRVLLNGAWGSASTTGEGDLGWAVDRARELARAPGASGSVTLAPFGPVRQRFSPLPDEPPWEVPMRDKAFLCRRYCELLASGAGGPSSRVLYKELVREKHVLNSAGTDVYEMECLCGFRLDLASQGSPVPIMRDVAWRGGFRRFRGLEPVIEEMAGEARSMASAVPAGTGVCPVILDPELAGAFAHEVFGHMSEGLPDEPDAPACQAPSQAASACISVVDDATHFEFPGSCAFDDEGIPGSRTTLVSGGSAGGRLHDLETAGRSGTRSTGNARSVDATSPPSPRMTCTYILPGISKTSDLLTMMSDGLYLRGALTGSTDRDNFSLTARSAFEVRSGRMRKAFGPVTIAGRIPELATSVEAAGDDLELFSGTAGCSRAGSGYLPVSYGGPHLLLGRVRHADA